MTVKDLPRKNCALCIDAGEYEGVSLMTLKIYEYIPEPASEANGLLRVIDEEGEPYYFDAKAFVKVKSGPRGLLIPFISSKRVKTKKLIKKSARR